MLIELINQAAISDLILSERMKIFEASYTFNIDEAPEYQYFQDILRFVPSRDKIKLILQDENENIFDLTKSNSTKEEYSAFLKDVLEDEKIEVRLEINKDLQENHFSIYCFEKFTEDLLSLSIEKAMTAFSLLYKEAKSFLIFDVFNSVPIFTTKTMFFIPYQNHIDIPDFNRVKRIEDCKGISYFYNFDRYEILPDDFKIEIDYDTNPLTGLFQKITLLLSITFIATSSEIQEDQVRGIINGQRAIEYNYQIKEISQNKVLYKIYHWIYTEGNATDKAVIARNVICLHCKYVPLIKMDEKVLASIQSNFNLYLKNNVIQYLELKNEIAKFISEIVSKTGEYATNLLNRFKTNLFAIFSFIFTVILANVVSSRPLNNIFTKDITTLMGCVIAGSFLYLVVCFFQLQYEIRKVDESYEQLKNNYAAILTEEDLKEIFKNDELLNKMKRSINISKWIWSGIWSVFLIATLITIQHLKH